MAHWFQRIWPVKYINQDNQRNSWCFAKSLPWKIGLSHTLQPTKILWTFLECMHPPFANYIVVNFSKMQNQQIYIRTFWSHYFFIILFCYDTAPQNRCLNPRIKFIFPLLKLILIQTFKFKYICGMIYCCSYDHRGWTNLLQATCLFHKLHDSLFLANHNFSPFFFIKEKYAFVAYLISWIFVITLLVLKTQGNIQQLPVRLF